MSNLQMLDLSSNQLKRLIPSDIPLSSCSRFALQGLLSLNLSDNPLQDLQEVSNTISVLMPDLTDLQISIFSEQDVNLMIQSLPKLTYLNNIPVQRNVIA